MESVAVQVKVTGETALPLIGETGVTALWVSQFADLVMVNLPCGETIDGQLLVVIVEVKRASTYQSALPFGRATVAFGSVVRASCAGGAPSMATKSR